MTHFSEKEGLSDKKITAIYRDKHNFLWVGTIYGLNKWDGYIFTTFTPQTSCKDCISNEYITQIAEDSKHQIYIATHKGINVYNPVNQSISHILHADKDSLSLPNDWVNGIYIDANDRLWVAADNRDLAKYNAKTKKFQSYPFKQFIQQINHPLKHKTYQSIEKIEGLSKDTLLLTTNLGIFYFYIPTSQFIKSNLKPRACPVILPNDLTATCWLEDKQKLIWIGTEKGLYLYNADFQYVKRVYNERKITEMPSPSPLTIFKGLRKTAYLKDSEGNQWWGIAEKGLVLLPNNSLNMIEIKKQHNNFLSNNITYLYEDTTQKTMWITTEDYGLYRYDMRKKTFILYQYESSTPNTSFAADICWQVTKDKKGNIWAATDPGGVSCFNYTKNSFKNYTTKEGLPSNIISGIICDKQGLIWASTAKGMATINPNTEQINAYTYLNGLPQEINLNYPLFLKENGEIGFIKNKYSPNVTEIVEHNFMINPHKIKIDSFQPTPILTNFSVFNQTIKLQNPVYEIDTILLDYTDNFFSFTFSSLNFKEINKNKYEYYLEPYEKTWKKANTQNFATYTNVPAGNYIFHIQSMNADNIYSKEKKIYCMIKPPFWQTKLFYLLISVLLLLVLFGIYKARIYQLNQQNEKEKLKLFYQKQLASAEMKALQAQMNPHFIFNVLTSISRFIIKNENELAINFLTQFARLIRNVLDSSNESLISLEKELDILRQYIEIEKLRFSHTFTYKIEVEEQLNLTDIFVPPLILQTYTENAIWHGLMQKKIGTKSLIIKVFLENNLLFIWIEDNGIGRNAAKELKSKQANQQKSYGMKLSKDRLNMINELFETTWEVEILDLYDEQSLAKGTRVIVFQKEVNR
ncbi:MAG: two-component regulator propeller domain-containing protein [Bacteroidia bacterium]